MAENTTKKMRSYNIKPIFILTIAAILLAKTQKAATEESVQTAEPNTSEYPICPDYCNLSADRATRGKAPFRMWYFDSSEGTCKRFRWSGRGGNKNRFYKKVDCEETCSKCTLSELVEDSKENDRPDMIPDAVCSPSVDEGKCDQDQTPKTPELMWHFNKDKAKCSPFIFYGCGGNTNRFASKNDCEDICH